jgi:ubiquinone/menaquinone biosynthesis C-methylase UbiE
MQLELYAVSLVSATARALIFSAIGIRELNEYPAKGCDGIVVGVDLGFSGEVADLYHRYRHGYPDAVIDALAGTFELTGQDVVVDLGCGTGQLALPMARRVRAVVGVDPEPDMLRRARQAAQDLDVIGVSWMLGTDADIPALRGLLGDRSAAAVTIGQALHWMNHTDLFRAVIPLVRAGGGIAVVTNGTPLWLQDTDWSRALRGFMERWLDTKLTYACGTDEDSQRRYRQDLAAAGFEVLSAAVDYDADLDLDQLAGGVYSALGAARLPAPDQRAAFVEQVRAALAPHDHFTEHVHVAILVGRVR